MGKVRNLIENERPLLIKQAGSFNFKNRIINGEFKVWQRGKEFTGNIGYSADRMYVDNQGQGLAGKGKIAIDSVSLVDNYDPFGDGSGVDLWKLDGNANSATGNYNGTWSGTASYNTGVFGQCAIVNISNFIILPNIVRDVIKTSQTNNQFSISCFMKKGAIGSNASSSGGICNFLYINNLGDVHIDNWKFGGGDTPSSWKVTTVDANKFNHIVLMKLMANRYSLYINGSKITEFNRVNNSIVLDLYLGKLFNGDASGLTGTIDQFRIFNRALTEDEIKKLYFEESKIIDKPAFSNKITNIPNFTVNYIKPLEYRFEGQHLYDLAQNGKKVTVSFNMNSRKSGTYAIALQNQTDSFNVETILQEFTYNGNQDEKIEVTFDTSLFTTPVKIDENLGLVLTIAGYTQDSNLVGSIGLNSGDKLCTSSCTAYSNNDFISISELQLEEGDYATDFEYVPYDIELQRCMRYYEKFECDYDGSTPLNSSYSVLYKHKRVIPSVVLNILSTSSASLVPNFEPSMYTNILKKSSGRYRISNNDSVNVQSGSAHSIIILDAEL